MWKTTYDSRNNVFSGRKCEPIYNPKACLGDLFIENILSIEGSYRIVKKYVKLLGTEVNRGDVICSIVPGLDPSDPSLMLFYVAAIIHGNPIHFIDHRAGPAEIQNAIQLSKAKTISLELEINDDVDDTELLSLIGGPQSDIVALFSTAGISGLPKLVPMSTSNVIHHLSGPFHSPVPSLSFQPLSKYRIFLDALAKFVGGITMDICTEFSLKIFQEKCPTDFKGDLYLTNYQLTKIVSNLEEPMELVQQIHCSGSYANPMLIRRAKSLFPNAKVVYSYGLTEFAGPVAINPNAAAKYTAGQLNNNFEVVIKDGVGNNLGVGCEGEICVKSPTPFTGYYQNEECTKSTLTDDGWCWTGDIGYFDGDLDFHILDREKEIIICDCNVISPAELEYYIKKIPGVLSVKVYGVPDKDLGEKPAAKVILNTQNENQPTEDVIQEFILNQLGPLKSLKGGIQFVDKL